MRYQWGDDEGKTGAGARLHKAAQILQLVTGGITLPLSCY